MVRSGRHRRSRWLSPRRRCHLRARPSDAVQPFYAHPGLELEASARDRFVDPALNVLNQNDAIKS